MPILYYFKYEIRWPWCYLISTYSFLLTAQYNFLTEHQDIDVWFLMIVLSASWCQVIFPSLHVFDILKNYAR